MIRFQLTGLTWGWSQYRWGRQMMMRSSLYILGTFVLFQCSKGIRTRHFICSITDRSFMCTPRRLLLNWIHNIYYSGYPIGKHAVRSISPIFCVTFFVRTNTICVKALTDKRMLSFHLSQQPQFYKLYARAFKENRNLNKTSSCAFILLSIQKF